jgi:hypothetical protein
MLLTICLLEKVIVSNKANKFNIHWQLARTQVRKIKDVDAKIKFIMNFLNRNKNIHNYGRVHNWLKMTGVAYKDDKRQKFVDAVSKLEANKSKYSSTADNENDLSKMSKDDLKLVYKDLSKRKYGFQYKSVPKAHTDFMDKLKKALED